ncbi:reverse transcriptase domain-containing protein [Tanacetum coccineum]
MPFGLRNAKATYQRLVDKTFHRQIGRNLEVYVDDLVIKSLTEDEVIRDIEETFRTLRKINMKLNPKKCTFGVEEGMFLGYQVNTKGIKICPDKVDAVLSLQSPKCLKDVQKLNGKLASLNRCLAKSAEKSLPFFKTLKKCMKKSYFLWTEEAESAFRQMKELIAKLPMLYVPEEKEELVIYLAASKETVSVVLMTERKAKQMPIYFVSRALRGLEVNYTSMEKLVLALVHASKRLRSMHAGTRSVIAKALRIGYYWPTMHKDARALIKACQECQSRLVERANQSLGEGIKARLGKDNKNSMEEVSHVLWAHRTMIKTSNGDTPFSLTYETEVVIPAKKGMPTFRTAEVDVTKNDEALEINLELLEEKREQAAIREAKSK